MTTIGIFAIAGIGTYLLRASMILAPSDMASSPWLERRIGLLSPAVLAAIVATGLLVSDQRVVLPNAVEVAAVIAALVAVHRTKNISAALLVGLPVYWLGALAGFA